MPDSNRTLKRIKAIEGRLSEQEAKTNQFERQLGLLLAAHNKLCAELDTVFRDTAKQEKPSLILPGKVH